MISLVFVSMALSTFSIILSVIFWIFSSPCFKSSSEMSPAFSIFLMLSMASLRMTPIWHEDEEFTPRALYYARRIQYLPVRVYNYLQRSDSFMGNYKPQSRLDLVRAMKSLTCFASRIGAEDPSGARLMRLHVGKTMSLACKQTVVRQLGNAREMLREARRQGIMPLEFRRRDFRHFLINRLPGLYVLYYKLHKKRK